MMRYDPESPRKVLAHDGNDEGVEVAIAKRFLELNKSGIRNGLGVYLQSLFRL